MTADNPLTFVDTTILVYAFARDSSPRKAIAVRPIRELMDGDRLRVSTQVLQELFVTLTRKVKQPCSVIKAVSILDNLTAWPLTVVDYPAIRLAAELANQGRLSFRDALVVVAAERSGAEVLYTEDPKHGQEILGVQIRNPFVAE